MPTPHEAVAALPIATAANQSLVRALLVGRNLYFLEAADNPQDFTAVDPTTGDIPPVLGFNNQLYWFDPADTTTVHDGVTTLVSVDGKRFKLENLDLRVRAVKDRLGVPPVSPALGDSYLVITPDSGAWNTKADDIAVWNGQAWKFQTAAVGQVLYVRDEDAYYHWSDAGAWVAGFGDSLLSANSVVPSTVLGGFVRFIVVNQTTNTPPGAPADGVTYIIGPSPTGVWAGHAAKIAIAKGSVWTILAPVKGWEAYDQALSNPYEYSGTSWAAKGGVFTEYVMAATYPTVAALFTQAHGLAALPSRVDVYLECIIAQLGYAIGDRLDTNSLDGAGNANRHVNIITDTTNVRLAIGAISPAVVRPDTFIVSGLIEANWKIVARVFS